MLQVSFLTQKEITRSHLEITPIQKGKKRLHLGAVPTQKEMKRLHLGPIPIQKAIELFLLLLINTSKGNTISKIPPTPMHTSSGTDKMMTTAPTPTRLTGTATRGLLAKSMQAGKARVMETSWQRKRMLSPIPEPSTASLCPLM